MIGLAEGVDTCLPVAVPFHRDVAHPGHALHVIGIEVLGHGIQILLKRLHIRIERIPDEPAPFPARIAGQPRSGRAALGERSEEHTSELQSLMRISYAVFCLKKKTIKTQSSIHTENNQ